MPFLPPAKDMLFCSTQVFANPSDYEKNSKFHTGLIFDWVYWDIFSHNFFGGRSIAWRA